MNPNPYESPQIYSPATRTGVRLNAIGLTVACVMFLLSLCCSTIVSGTDKGFLLGMICLLLGMDYLAWYANPFIFLSGLFLLRKRHHWAAGCAAIAVALSLTALQIKEVEVNEAGTKGPVTDYGLGFYVWIGSSIVLLLTSVVCVVIGCKKSNSEAVDASLIESEVIFAKPIAV